MICLVVDAEKEIAETKGNKKESKRKQIKEGIKLIHWFDLVRWFFLFFYFLYFLNRLG